MVFVFIVGLCDEHFPSHVNNNIKNIEEERRLFYVGVTRAKHNLYFIASSKDLPLTRFIQEIDNKNIFKHKNETKNENNNKNLYGSNDKNFAINSYGVTDIIISLSGDDMNNMKKEKLVFDEINKENIEDLYSHIGNKGHFISDANASEMKYPLFVTGPYEEKLLFNKDISAKYLEADFGIYCDLVLTRKIMINSGQEIKDDNTLWILHGVELEDEEMEIYNMYNLQKYHCYNNSIFKNINNLDVLEKNTHKHEFIIKEIFKKINPKYEVRRKNTYPSIFLEQLKESYIKYCNPILDNNKILEDIYYVSLSNKIKSNRRRLIYMNVFNIFMDGFDKINFRINDYSDKIKNNKNICKSSFSYIYDNIECSLCGELDLLDKTEKNNYTIIDFKCSNDDVKLEWIIQLLLYYCLYCATTKNTKKIKALSIFNIMNGKTYRFDIPQNYDYTLLLKYMENVIKDVSNSNRQLILPPYMLIENKNNILQNIIPKEQTKNKIYYQPILQNNNIKNTIILDVETNCERGEIIQLAYMIFDEKYHLIKSVNKYVKDRIVSVRSMQCNNISNQMLKQKGELFDKVMEEFISDISLCKLIVGHNIESDCRIINKNYSPHIDLFDNKEIFCTMKNGKSICNLKNINGAIKNPKLEELYYELFKIFPQECHDAIEDVKYTAECYFFMKFTTLELIEIIKNMNQYCDIIFRTLRKKINF
jgi:DNA polymerase-3 subunit epsilon